MINVINKYLSKILEITHATGIYAYRGQQDSRWVLHSAATRRLIGEHGCDIVAEPDFAQLYINYHLDTLIEPARTRGFGSQSGHRLPDLQLLAKLQHFGAATGLLDFTWSPLVALWFACEEATCNGKLYAINTNDPIRVARVSSDEKRQDLKAVFSGADGTPQLSYWEPMTSGDASDRILRQRSVFIIGRPLIPIDNAIISEITVAKDDKESLRTALETLDFHQDSLFQDVYGFAQASNRKSLPPRTSQAYVRSGNRYYQRGEYAEARVAYSKSIELFPNASLTYFLRGNVHAASGRHKEAIEDYDKAVGLMRQLHHSIKDTVYFNRGNSRAEIADYKGAVQDYTEAIKRNPSSPQYYYNRGNAYVDLCKFNEAVQDYRQVTGQLSRDATFNRGNALLAMGRLNHARHYYQDAITKGADHVGISQNIWALDQISPLLSGLKYKVTAAPEEGAGTMCLRFELPEEASQEKIGLERFLFFGRVGNVGNYGGPGLSGGEGFMGKKPIRVYEVVRNRDKR